MAAERVLLVEDDPHIGASLLRAFTATGYDTAWTRTGTDAIASFTGHPADLVLLDLGLPDLDGLDVCRQIRDLDPDATIMMLTARDDELDIVIGLDAGAVDYITKPFTLAELLARVRAQLRRSPPTQAQPTEVGDVRVDESSRRAWIGGVEVSLRPKEFDLLARLLRDAGTALTRETLMSDVWDENWYGSTKTLDFHVAALRRRIDTGSGPSRITTLRGVGYRYEIP
jgi:DNA-binding response OmpR family regulator